MCFEKVIFINMTFQKRFSSSVLRSINPHSDSVYTHSGCLDHESCLTILFWGQLTYTVVLRAHTVVVCVVMEGGDPDTQGPWTLFSIGILSWIIPHSGSVSHTVLVYVVVGWEGGLQINRGPSKLFSSSFWRWIDPHSNVKRGGGNTW